MRISGEPLSGRTEAPRAAADADRAAKRPLRNLPLMLFLAACGFLVWGGLTRGHEWGNDFAAYILQARSVVEGRPQQFIESSRFTNEQSSSPVGPVAYPWGFPVLLAPIYAVFGLNILALKTVGAACFLLFIATLWFGFRTRHSGIWRIFLVALFALNPALLAFLDNVLSDVPFLLLSTLAMLLIERVVIEKRRLISSAWDHLLLGGVVAMACQVRVNGVLLLAVLAISQSVEALCRFRTTGSSPASGAGDREAVARRAGIALLPYGSFAAVTLAWCALLPQGVASYASQLAGLSLASIRQQTDYYLTVPAAFFGGVRYPEVLYGATIPLALAGMFDRRRSDYPMIVYIMLTFLLYVLWLAGQGFRFFFPILPFYISFALSGLSGSVATARMDRAKWKVICVAPVILVLLLFARRAAEHVWENLSDNRQTLSGPFAETSKEMFLFIAKSTEPGSAVAFCKPRAMTLMTGRRSVMINRSDQLSRADYLCLYLRDVERDQVSRADLQQLAQEGRVEETFRNADFEVYRLSAAR